MREKQTGMVHILSLFLILSLFSSIKIPSVIHLKEEDEEEKGRRREGGNKEKFHSRRQKENDRRRACARERWHNKKPDVSQSYAMSLSGPSRISLISHTSRRYELLYLSLASSLFLSLSLGLSIFLSLAFCVCCAFSTDNRLLSGRQAEVRTRS